MYSFKFEIEFPGGEYKMIRFEAEPEVWNDGIGGYEFWGSGGYDKGGECVGWVFEWDMFSLTTEENEWIEDVCYNEDNEFHNSLIEKANELRSPVHI